MSVLRRHGAALGRVRPGAATSAAFSGASRARGRTSPSHRNPIKCRGVAALASFSTVCGFWSAAAPCTHMVLSHRAGV